jgi:hypothetical protein
MNAAEIVKALGGRNGVARCPAHDDKTPSLSISERDGKLLVHCFAGCDQQAVWDALRDRGLLPEREGGYRRRSATVTRFSTTAPSSDPTAEAKTVFARRIWAESRPAPGTPVECYLEGRDLTIEPPPTLRHHPGLKHGPTGLFLPAMVAAITKWPGCEVVAVHRTFLVADGRKKAPVSQNRMMLGPCTGGAVRLAEHDDELVLAEGIETALSVLQASGRPTWATLSTSGLKSVRLPSEVTTVIIAADGDDPGLKAAEEAASRFHNEGREVRIAKPPPGMDFNDLLMLPANVVPFPGRREAANG